MFTRFGADLVVVVHFLFIAFALMGAVLVLWKAWFAMLHLPALAWGLWIELSHGVCPLTPLENSLRMRAGLVGYRGGFIDHYLIPLIYPSGLQPSHQLWLAVGLGAFNLVLYAWVIRRYLAPRS